MSIINSLENFIKEDKVSEELKEAFHLYEKIKSALIVEDIYEELRNWLYGVYKIHNIKITITKVDGCDLIFHNGKEYDIDSELSLNFSIDINDESSIMFSFLCDNEEHFKELDEKYIYLNTIFYLITPLINTTFLEEKVKDTSVKDPVTGLYNRKYLLEHLEKMLPLARREQKKVAFLMVGIDHFKAVIDEFDYEIGDKVLIELASTLQEAIRTSDIVIRLDADEFLVVLANVQNKDSAVSVAQKLVESFGNRGVDVNSYTGQTLKKTVCIGISMYPEDSTSIDQILKNADISLYEARNNGRSQVLVFSKDQESSVDLF
ncbi:MAG: GGDEF domain-containing protein [Campylobacteraceae bacterium]|nr:GGDEF domain-containing protein [Campylobacteraceae bacterium]